MFQLPITNHAPSNPRCRQRRGIVLLIVLGMLSLFTVLVVSFVVFSSQAAQTSYSNKERQRFELPVEAPINAAVLQLIVGTNDPSSAAFGHSLLEDMYGTDGVQMRVGHSRGSGLGGGFPQVPRTAGGQLLLPLLSNGQPETTLFKFPTNLVSWYFDGSPGIAASPGNDTLSPVDRNRFHFEQRPDLDDVFSGRLVTFDEGPLAGHTFRVLRSFGRQNGQPENGRLANPPPAVANDFPLNVVADASYNNAGQYDQQDYDLAGNLIIDLAELPTEVIEFEGTTQLLYDVAANAPNALLYGNGPDGAPGRFNVDDDVNGTTDDASELGAAGSDDYGYRFTLNGVPFNGRGRNPSGLTGIGRETPAGIQMLDQIGDIELQLNGSFMGATARADNGSGNGLFPEPDEQYDVADMENNFLAWQPSDHRRVNWRAGNFQPVYTGVDADELNRQLGSHLIPSFHRPAVINYLMNAPIIIPSDPPHDPTATIQVAQRRRNFATIFANPDFAAPNLDHIRLATLITRVRRATMRPLNISHFAFSQQASDLNGDGVPFDGAPGFSGTNPAPVMNEVLDLSGNLSNGATFSDVAGRFRRLALWLVNGPWDVDNDGDRLPDSIWTDMGLTEIIAADGSILRPMVATLIEDMGGRINLNVHGNMGQLVETRFQNGPTRLTAGQPDRRFFDEGEYLQVANTLNSFGFGGGIGPAEVDFSHLFREPNVLAGFIGPVSTNQVGLPLGFNNVTQVGLLRSRYGNLLNVRQGGEVYDYLPPYPNADALRFPGTGTLTTTPPNTDLLSRIPMPARQAGPHTALSPVGRPHDMAGVIRTRKDDTGAHQFTVPAQVGDVVNQPYESGVDSPLGDDQPFTAAEIIDVLDNGALGGRLSDLLSDAVRRNPALKNLLSVESRSVDSPEIPGAPNFVRILADKLTAASVRPADQQSHLDKMLAIELRKGSKLNLNRALGNGQDDNANGVIDEQAETRTLLATAPTEPNNLRSAESAFPQINASHPNQSTTAGTYIAPSYTPRYFGTNDFDGIDTDNDGVLDTGTTFSLDVDGDGTAAGNLNGLLKAPTSGELLARHLYVLMFTLIHDPDTGTNELVPNFPYPSPGDFTDIPARNRFVARQIAQWAVNAVDFRDTDPARTRLRYDPNPFNGFNPETAALHTVWGMERPELEITETLAMHDVRTKRNLDEIGAQPTEIADDEDNDPLDMLDPDSDMDQFRIPMASAFVELHSLRPHTFGSNKASFPRELYDANNRLDLGRTVGAGNQISPIWRIAVSAPTGADLNNSTRWLFDAERLGRELVAGNGREVELNYLNANGPGDWGDQATVEDFVDNTFNAGQRQAAEISHVPFSTGGGEFVRLADPDFNPINGSPHQVALERFVWFADLSPATANLHILDAARGSGMRIDNVFFNRDNQIVEKGATPVVRTARTVLNPGEYAVIGPRQSTVFGQTGLSLAPTYEYNPVEQRLEFAFRGAVAGFNQFRLNYLDISATNPMTPRYPEDNGAAHHIENVLVLTPQSLYPHEVDAAVPLWGGYVNSYHDPNGNNGAAIDEAVDMGFNISAPLPGLGYYPAPTHRISANGPTGGYPLVDGYRDYDAGAGFHPDVPFDHQAGRPMEDNTYTVDDSAGNPVTVHWNSIGTHQEVRTVFLQRLADPSQPWNAVDNPYLTEDFSPIDLTTYNGEADVTVEVDRDGDGDPTNDNYLADSARSFFDLGTNEFTPRVKMDSRRKIPAVRKDRALTALLPNGAGGNLDVRFDRVVVTKRSPLSATFSVLRESTIDNSTNAFWPYELGSAWIDQNLTADGDSMGMNDDLVDTNYDPRSGPIGLFERMDATTAQFKQTLGYVNREYGFPIRSDSNYAARFGVGAPDKVSMLNVTWMDRDFQSPLDLLNVPAVSRTRLLATFTPGTRIDGANSDRELPDNFGHLLGFQSRYSKFRAEDTQFDNGTARDRAPLGYSESVEDNDFQDDVNQFTGERAGFEQIFDFVDTGPVWFDSQRWFDPQKVAHRDDNVMTARGTVYTQRAELFNRAVTMLQPPYNYIGKHRTPGKINPNTMPDYIRKGPGFRAPGTAPPQTNVNEFLDLGENAIAPGSSPAVPNVVQSNPTNDTADGDGLTTEFRNGSQLFGNGSVYRALTWGISTPYELDNALGAPSVLGDNNAYARSVDTQFGHDFKAFIESRRGYAGTLNSGIMLNPDLDSRYPTRFAGVFSTARSAALPTVQRFMRGSEVPINPLGTIRRTHDMGLLRPHPDFDERLIPAAERSAHFTTPGDATYTLNVETDAASDPANDGSEGGANDTVLPTLTNIPAATSVQNLKMSMMNTGLFERPQAELHSSFRDLDRDSYFRYQNAARLANLTTHHSNVYLIRMTVGYFVVDPTTGAVGEEYTGPTGEPIRTRAKYLVDRTIPVAFLRGKNLNAENIILYSEVEE